MDIKDRIKEFLNSNGLSVNKFALTIGMPQVTVNNYISGKRKVSFELIDAIAKTYPDVSLDWLIRGEGEMIITPKLVTTPPEKDEPTSIGEAYYNKMIQQMEEHMKEIENRMDNIENKVS